MLAVADNVLRIINFIFLVICLGLVSSLINTQSHHSSRVNFALFAAAYGITTDSLYGVVANFWEPLAWPLILFILDFLNWVFTFTAGTALAVGIRAHSCNNQRYLLTNSITQGSETRCRSSQAAVAFFYFSMAIFLAKMIMSGIKMSTLGPFGTSSSSPFGSRFSRRNKANAKQQQQNMGVPTISEV